MPHNAVLLASLSFRTVYVWAMCERRIAVAGVFESAAAGFRVVVVVVVVCGVLGAAALAVGLAGWCLAFDGFATLELTAPAAVDAPNAMSRGTMTRTDIRANGRTAGAAGFIRSPFAAGHHDVPHTEGAPSPCASCRGRRVASRTDRGRIVPGRGTPLSGTLATFGRFSRVLHQIAEEGA